MNLVLFTHPEFLGSQSMPRFARSLAQAYAARGHQVQMRQPRARLRARVQQGPLAKWAGYVDQYLLFPLELRRQMRQDPPDTLYVFCDQALGPWVPCVAQRPHVVHCHDLLALRSALGLVPENPTGWSGRIYQRYIRRGFRQARHFISVSGRSRDDLHRYGGVRPVTSEVVHNALNYPFQPVPVDQARQRLQAAGLDVPAGGMVLHVSGGTWYKNVAGVLRLYGAYAQSEPQPLPLWLVGVPETAELQALVRALPPQARVHWLQGLSGPVLEAAYSLARAFVFPSLAEGFGWPIVEAQACGCTVLTTDDAPMNEIGGPHSVYLPLLRRGDDLAAWAQAGGRALAAVLARSEAERSAAACVGVAWAAQFDTDRTIDRYLTLYAQVLALERPAAA